MALLSKSTINAFFDLVKEKHPDVFLKIAPMGSVDTRCLRVYLDSSSNSSNMLSLAQELFVKLNNNRDDQNDGNDDRDKLKNEVNDHHLKNHIKNNTKNHTKTQTVNITESTISKEKEEDIFNCLHTLDTSNTGTEARASLVNEGMGDQKKKFSTKDLSEESIFAVQFEYEVLHGAYKSNKTDEARARALEDAHVRCMQTLEYVVEIKNSSDIFDDILRGVNYAKDNEALANALFACFIELS
jgi:hypothetical protein